MLQILIFQGDTGAIPVFSPGIGRNLLRILKGSQRGLLDIFDLVAVALSQPKGDGGRAEERRVDAFAGAVVENFHRKGFVHTGAHLTCVMVEGQQLEKAVGQHFISRQTVIRFVRHQPHPTEKGDFNTVFVGGAAIEGIRILGDKQADVALLAQGVFQCDSQQTVGDIQGMT